MNKYNLKVKGMMCEGCEKRIVQAIEENLDVEKVVANHKKGTVEIKAEDLDIEQAQEIITNLGFEIEE